MSTLHQLLQPSSQNLGWNNIYVNSLSANSLNIPTGTGASGAAFPSITLTNESNQIYFGPSGGQQSVFNVNMPAGSTQTLTVKDSGVTATNFILQDCSTSQTVNSIFNVHSNLNVGLTGTQGFVDLYGNNGFNVSIAGATGLAASRTYNLPEAGANGFLGVAINGSGIVGQQPVISVSSATNLTSAESGSIVTVNPASSYNVNLPAVGSGLNYDFYLNDASLSNQVGIASTSGAVQYGAAQMGSTWTAWTGVTNIIFNTGAQRGEQLHLKSDGTNWYASGNGITSSSFRAT